MKMGVFDPAVWRKSALLSSSPSAFLPAMARGTVSVRHVAHVFGALKIAERPASARMHHAYLNLALWSVLTSPEACTQPLTLQILGPVERLLLLEEERIADERKSADRLAVGSGERLD